uniref:ABC transmembrane type-1 domain-containing protein n=1 Tax=Panagrolaimus superbus TaxID=310955 RepID=A0A914YS52_9BILA
MTATVEPLIGNGITNGGDAVYNPTNGIIDHDNDDDKLLEVPVQPVAFIDLFRFGNRCDKIRVLLGIIFGIFAGTAIVLPFFFSAQLANALILKQNDTKSDELIDIGIFYISIDLGFGLVIFISVFLQYYLLKVACANIVENLRKAFMESLVKQDAAWLSQQQFGAISAQLTENINTIREGIGEKLGSVIRGVSSFFAAITLSFIADWRLALIPLVTGPMAVAMALLMTKLINKAEAKQQQFVENSGAILQESIMNVTTIQCCNGEKQMENKYRLILKKARAFAVRTYVWTGIFEGLTFCILYFFFAADFCVGALMYFKGLIKQPGEVFIVPNTFFNGAWTLGTVSPYFIAIQKARMAAAHIYAKIDRIPVTDATGNETIENGGEIEFKNVHFSYETRRNVLNGLSFKAEAGKTTALVSHSGGGKSTSVSTNM